MKIIITLIVSLLFAGEGTVLTIDNYEFSLHDFFARYPKKQWERADSLKKNNMFTEFVKRELCVLEAKRLGFENDPEISVKIRNLSQQILVNESYEQFVARPLIPLSELEIARKFAKTELLVSHILIGYSGAYLGSPPERTLDEALVLSRQIKNEFDGGEAFDVLAEKYSDDPGVEKNSGSIGWVQWGATVQKFQLAAFALEKNVLSDPVLTDFGYHLILIGDVRQSDYQYLDDDAYESFVVNITKNSIRDQLYPAALKYDSLKIDSFGVLFNMNAIRTIIRSYDRFQKESSLVGNNKADSVTLLESLNELGVICVYGGRGFGPRWFSQRLGLIPSTRRPQFISEDEVVSVFKTIILQDIAINDGLSGGISSSFIYKKRCGEMVSGLLYDAYLKYLVNSAPVPDTLTVADYYDKNKAADYMEPEKIIVREIRVSKRSTADSLLLLLGAGSDFSLLAQKNSSINPDGGGLYGPFSNKQNRSFFNAASLLKEGEFSSVISSSGNNFSIIQLVERVSTTPRLLDHVYMQIESLLIKKNQDDAKTEGVDGLLKVYVVNKDMSLLN